MKEFKEFWNIEHFSNDCLEDIIKDYLNNKQMETSQDLENNEFSGIDRQEIKIKIDKDMFDCKNVVQDFVDSLNNANLPQKASVKDNDYFTPDIEDIRVGYECEICPHLGYDNTWIPTVGRCEQNSAKDCNLDELTYDCLIDGYVGIRTPYLTREQIEAEGWKFKHTNKTRWWYEKDDTFFECPMTNGYQIMRLEMVHDPEFKAIRIQAYYRGEAGYDKSEGVDLPTIFEGYCKDINTFRYISKLLNIK